MRFLMLLTLCGAVLGAPGEEELPKTTRLSKTSLRSPLHRNFLLPSGKTEAKSPAVRKGRIAGRYVLFLDLDGDGTFNEPEIDGWSLTGMKSVLPLEPTAVLALGEVAWKIDADGGAVHYGESPYTGDRTVLRAFQRLNDWRLLNGLCPVEWNAKLSDGCAKHIQYIVRYGVTHTESKANAGYTPEGARAGEHSCLAPVGVGMSVLMCYASFYHRLPLFRPDTRSIGLATAQGYTAIDGLSDRKKRPWQWPVIIPAPGATYQPTRCALESPCPYPRGIEPGFPITLTFPLRAKITGVTAKLTTVRGKHEIPIEISWPEKPANPERADNRDSICLIPTEPLKPRTEYAVSVSYTWDGKKDKRDWEFATGIQDRPVYKTR